MYSAGASASTPMSPKPTFAWCHCCGQHVPEHHFLVPQQSEPRLPLQQRDALPAAGPATAAAAAGTAAVVSYHETTCGGNKADCVSWLRRQQQQTRYLHRCSKGLTQPAAVNGQQQPCCKDTRCSMQSCDCWDTSGGPARTCEAQLLLQEGLPVGPPQALIHFLEGRQGYMHACMHVCAGL